MDIKTAMAEIIKQCPALALLGYMSWIHHGHMQAIYEQNVELVKATSIVLMKASETMERYEKAFIVPPSPRMETKQ